jgi:phosphoribosyl 1,2-cyclic phosphodiesterase
MTKKGYIKFWGVRGSMAAGTADTAGYGGDTPCVEISYGGDIIICDAGSGIRRLGDDLMKRSKRIKASILFSHIHLDHVIGLPFFRPLYEKGNAFDLIDPGRTGPKLRSDLKKILGPPYFPVQITKVPARLKFKSFSGDQLKIGKIKVRSFECFHPDSSFAFKFYLPDGKIIVHTSDNEPSKKLHRAFVRWIKGADILIHDAQYTPKQYDRKQGWGHSAYLHPIRLAAEAGIKKLFLFHYDPASTDRDLDRVLVNSKKFARLIKSGVEVRLSRQGMKVSL